MRVTILSSSDIPNDPRVMRQIELLRDTKQSVHAIGYGSSDLDGVLEAFQMPRPGWRRRVGTGMRLVASRFGTARAIYWASKPHREMLRSVIASRPDIIHVNDWHGLPIAVAAGRELGCRVLYDSHEFAVGERDDDFLWRLLFRPYIRTIERSHINNVDAVVTVSESIAARLQQLYRLPELPTVVRNVPRYSEQRFRPAANPLKVVYQGAYLPDRNLESLILSVTNWKPDRRLILRGMGAPNYEARLRKLARDTGVGTRIEFTPPVKPNELVAAANEADIGIHPIAPLTVQTKCCLPNKFFEYIMAGLCLVVSSAEEMARLVRKHRLGVVLTDTGPDAIARAINELTPEAIEDYKRNALAAARWLNWDREKYVLEALYTRLAA